MTSLKRLIREIHRRALWQVLGIYAVGAYERLGENEQADGSAERFIGLWKDCDPELRRLVEEAEQRLARLTGEPAGP